MHVHVVWSQHPKHPPVEDFRGLREAKRGSGKGRRKGEGEGGCHVEDKLP